MDHYRHSSIFNAHSLDITLIGCGGIGATTALALAKMGVGRLDLWDADYVSSINLATQLHALSEVNNSKVEAVERMLAEFADDTEVNAIGHHVNGSHGVFGSVIISAVDSIEARKEIWQAVLLGGCTYYLDARMASEELHVYCVSMENPTWYDDMLAAEDDTNVIDEPCTSKATIYCSFLAGAIIGKTVKQIVTNVQPPRIFIQNLRNDALTVIS